MADKKRGRPWYKNPAIIIPIAVALIGAIATIVAPIIGDMFTSSSPETISEAHITAPVHNQIISGDAIQIEGYLTSGPEKGHFLYTVVEANEPLWWPEQVIPAYSQMSDCYEFKCTHWIAKTGEGRELLEIKVVMVDSAIHDQFQKWRSNCIAADDWPGIPVININEWGQWETCAGITAIYE